MARSHPLCSLACSCITSVSACYFTRPSLCLCLSCSALLRTLTLDVGSTLIQDDFISTFNCLQRPCLQIRFHSHVPDGHEFGGVPFTLGLPWWLSRKEPACNAGAAGDVGSIPRSGRSPGGEHGNPLQYSCLENPMDRRTWWATAHEFIKNQI